MTAAHSEAADRFVVAAVIRRGGRILAAQRAYPLAAAGRWEFPGGKVEAGESLAAALIRECQEELGVTVRPGPELGRHGLPGGAVLVFLRASLADGAPEPQAREHQALRWCVPGELGELNWLETNRAVSKFASLIDFGFDNA